MTPGQASQAGTMLEILHPRGFSSLPAHVFDLESGGIAWMDAGWNDPWSSGHAAHYIEGGVEPVAGMPNAWLLVTADGDDVPIVEAAPRQAEGSRSRAAEVLAEVLDVRLR